jgi:small subunit ribosomal protein S1
MQRDDDNGGGAGEDFAALFAEFEGKAKQQGGRRDARREVQVGELVRGRVVSIGADDAFVSIQGGKSEGMLPLEDLRDEAGKLTAKVGDEIEARVVEVDGRAGCVVLRRSLGRGPDAKAELAQAAQLGVPVVGTVTAVNKGGVEVTVAGVRGFCPISQLELRHVDDAAAYVGRKLSFRITRYELDRRGANLVLSRRALLEEEARAKAAETRTRLAPGAVVSGTVVAVKDFGAFVDLGGLEGLVPASELGFGRGTKPADVVAVGQTIEVQVLRIEKTDDQRRPERITLSLKALATDPWDEAVARFAPGTKARGRVTRVESFGAFVELAPGLEGLLHVSELAGGRQARHARDLVAVGAEVEVTVLSIDRERRRVSLGSGDREDVVDPDALAAVRAAAPAKLGTLGDLLSKNLKR